MRTLWILTSLLSSSTLFATDKLSESDLKKAILFYSSFDKSEHADFARGDSKLYTAASLKRETVAFGLKSGVARLDERGRFGGSLFYPAKTSMITFYKGGSNIAYAADRPYGMTIAFWMSLSPDQDLPEGYVDPLQITDKKWNDAAVFVDFNKPIPRDFRLGMYSDFEFWNPDKLKFDQIPASELPLITVRSPPFRRDRWTHVAITMRDINSDNETSSASLYLNGQLQGTLDRRQRFTWDTRKVVVMLGIYYVGHIDDFAIFDREFSGREIESLFELPKGLKPVIKNHQDDSPR